MFTFRERGFYMKEKIQKRAKRIRIRWKKRKVKITVALLLLVWLAVIIVLLKHWRLFGRSANGGSVKGIVQWAFLWIIGIAGAILWQFYALFLRKQRTIRRIGIGGMIPLAIAMGTGMFWVMEWIYNPQMFTIPYQYVALSICVSAIVFLILLLLCNSLWLAVLLCSCLYFAWTVASYFTYMFRGLPLQIVDLLDLRTAATVAGDYEYTITLHMLIVGAVITSIVTSLFVANRYQVAKSKKTKILIRIIGLVVLVGGIRYLGWSEQPERWSIELNGNRPGDSFYSYGMQMCVIRGARDAIVKEPAGYEVEELQQMADDTKIQNTRKQERPNIIAIMDETFSDLTWIRDFPVSDEIIPFYNSLKENTIKGKVLVPALGGGTGKTEFEFLTGTSMRMLSSTPYVALGKKLDVSLVKPLEEQGYTTVAMHPYVPTNYNREVVYETMGFDRFLSLEDFEGDQTIRGFISDEACFDKIVGMIEEEENPLFTFCVTMQNHSPYTKSYDASVKLTEYKDERVDQYLSLVHESDRALQNLIEHLKESDEPTVVVFFGDHLPSLSEEFYQYLFGIPRAEVPFEEYQNYYLTPFLIWANYDIEEQENVITSSNYLGAMTVEAAGVELTKYQQYLLNLREEVPAFGASSYLGQDGKFHEYGAGGQEENSLNLDDSVNYNKIFDRKNRINDLFFLDSKE